MTPTPSSGARARTLVLSTLALIALTDVATGQSPRVGSGPSWERARTTTSTAVHEGRRYVLDELVVGLDDWSRRRAVEAEIERRGGRVTGAIPRLGALKVVLPPASDAAVDRDRFADVEGVRYAEPNGVGRAGGLAPDDTWFHLEWQLDNTGQTGGTPGADLDVLRAWDIEQGDPSVVVAVLDTGIDFDHPEFAGRLLPGFDFKDDDPDPTASNPHGLFVTGLLAANTNNTFGVAGIDQRCTVLPVRVLGVAGGGNTFDIAQGIDFAAAEGADVLSMSLISFGPDQVLVDALAAARAAGSILMACAGNNGVGDADVSWPGASPDTIAIGWTDKRDRRPSDSGSGAALDFMAPGKETRTVHVAHTDFSTPFDGCSAATPLASGIVSLMLAVNPDLDQDTVYELLRLGAEDQVGQPAQDLPGRDDRFGHGRLNAAESLTALCSCSGPQPLVGSPPFVDTTTGGTQRFELDAGAAHAGRPYLILGSAAGTAPGILVWPGQFPLSLNRDAYFRMTRFFPNTGLLPDSFGTLDGDGRAVAHFVLPAGTGSSMAGMELDHAFVVFDRPGTGKIVAASNPVPLRLD